MECVYCLSSVDERANVCKVCKRDLYLFRPLLEKVKDLEAQLAQHQDPVELQTRVAELEALLAAEQARHEQKHASPWRLLADVCQFLLMPLILLLLAHAMITVVYDVNLLYLRIASVILPMPFGFYLFKNFKRSIFGWFAATAGLAAASVIGMSAITSLVDQTPVMPQSMVEWREFIEYAASITFSFLTGMLLGGVAYQRAHRTGRNQDTPFLVALVSGYLKEGASPKDIHLMIKKLEDTGSSLVAIGTTAMSVYTGLKAFI